MQSSIELETQLEQIAASILNLRRVEIERVSGGGNNQLFRVSGEGRSFALKRYPIRLGDSRDRFAIETQAIAFLRRLNCTTVPNLIGADAGMRVAIYDWIEGEHVDEIRPGDIVAAVAFVEALYSMCRVSGARDLPLASEACLSGRDIVSQLDRRLNRLRGVAGQHSTLRQFIDKSYVPTYRQIVDEAQENSSKLKIAFDSPIAWSLRTLSPSDFGFHNARRSTDGSVIFLDLEYFGWDDPVKLTSDFLLHPGMILGQSHKREFAQGVRAFFGADNRYRSRLRSFLPLYALRWSLILLNEFLPEVWERRVAAGNFDCRSDVLARQIAKAERMLAAARESLKVLDDDE